MSLPLLDEQVMNTSKLCPSFIASKLPQPEFIKEFTCETCKLILLNPKVCTNCVKQDSQFCSDCGCPN